MPRRQSLTGRDRRTRRARELRRERTLLRRNAQVERETDEDRPRQRKNGPTRSIECNASVYITPAMSSIQKFFEIKNLDASMSEQSRLPRAELQPTVETMSRPYVYWDTDCAPFSWPQVYNSQQESEDKQVNVERKHYKRVIMYPFVKTEPPANEEIDTCTTNTEKMKQCGLLESNLEGKHWEFSEKGFNIQGPLEQSHEGICQALSEENPELPRLYKRDQDGSNQVQELSDIISKVFDPFQNQNEIDQELSEIKFEVTEEPLENHNTTNQGLSDIKQELPELELVDNIHDRGIISCTDRINLEEIQLKLSVLKTEPFTPDVIKYYERTVQKPSDGLEFLEETKPLCTQKSPNPSSDAISSGKSKTYPRQHNLFHTEEKPYKCDVCGKTFSKKGHLKQHETTHMEEKPHECDICAKSFSRKDGLRKHRKTHTGEKSCMCDVCGKTFSQNSHLKRHTMSHTEEKPYKCDACGKCFSMASNLTIHKRTHTGEKPYTCDICGKTFSVNCSLKTHKRTHTGEKPYTCDVCGKTFSGRSSLQCHKRTHQRKRKYLCSLCNLILFDWFSLQLHTQTHSCPL